MRREHPSNGVRRATADSWGNGTWSWAPRSQQRSRVDADDSEVHINAAKWANGVLKPTTPPIEPGREEKEDADEGMPEPTMEVHAAK